jgi:hypothetical protein
VHTRRGGKLQHQRLITLTVQLLMGLFGQRSAGGWVGVLMTLAAY